MPSSYLLSFFRATTSAERFRTNARADGEANGDGKQSYLALKRMSSAELTLAFEHLLSLQYDILAFQEDDDRSLAKLRLASLRLQYCRALLLMLLLMTDTEVCLQSLARMKEILDPSLLEMRVPPGKCRALGFQSEGHFDMTGNLDPDEGRRLLSALALFGLVPTPWHDALVAVTLLLLTGTYDWINYPLCEIPATFWLWAESCSKDGREYKFVSHIVLTLCLNHDVAREVIRRSLLDRLTSILVDPENRINDAPFTDEYHALVLPSTYLLQGLAIIACLEIPEFNVDLRTNFLDVVLPKLSTTMLLSQVCLCNPQLRELIMKTPRLRESFKPRNPSARWGASLPACFGLSPARKLEIPSDLTNAFDGSRRQTSKRCEMLETMRQVKNPYSFFVLPDSMVRYLNNVTLPNGLTLAHLLVLKSAHVWWLGVSKRGDRNGLLPMFQDGRYGTCSASRLSNFGLKLAQDDQVEIHRSDLIKVKHVHPTGIYFKFGSWQTLFRLAEVGFFTEANVAELYLKEPIIQHELPLDRCRALWLTSLRFPDGSKAFGRQCDQFEASSLPPTEIGRVRIAVLSFLFRSSLILSIVAMQGRVKAGRSLVRRTPISLLTRDILTKLFLEHLEPPRTSMTFAVYVDLTKVPGLAL